VDFDCKCPIFEDFLEIYKLEKVRKDMNLYQPSFNIQLDRQKSAGRVLSETYRPMEKAYESGFRMWLIDKGIDLEKEKLGKEKIQEYLEEYKREHPEAAMPDRPPNMPVGKASALQ